MKHGFSPQDEVKIDSAWELGAKENIWGLEAESDRGWTRLHNETLPTRNLKSSLIVRVT